jgi:hypothetical protein
MTTPTTNLLKRWRLGAAVGLAALLAPAVQAANITLNASDTLGTSSFAAAGNWSNGQAPSAEHDYFTNGFLMRTPSSATAGSNLVFAGKSLTANTAAASFDPANLNIAFMFKGPSYTATVNNMILDGAYIRAAEGTTTVFTLAGNLNVTSRGGGFHTQGGLIISSLISGSGSINIAASGNTEAGRVVTFTNPNNTFDGSITVPTANQSRLTISDTGVLNFTVGAAGVNTRISGSGVVNFNGAFKFNLTNASTTIGDNWLLIEVSTLAETFGPTFTIQGFTRQGTVWTGKQGNTFYQFDQSTGVLSVIPTPPDYPPPAVTQAPRSTTVLTGSNVTLSVVASGLGNLTYQWSKGGTNIQGATSNSLPLTNLQAADAAVYSVTVTDDAALESNLQPATTTVSATVTVLANAADAVVAYYRFEEGSDGSGLFGATDSVGGNELTALGTISYSSDVPAATVVRTGASNQLSSRFADTGNNGTAAPTFGTLANTDFTDFTIEAWVRHTNLAGFQTIVGRDDSGNAATGQGLGDQSLLYFQKNSAGTFRLEVITSDNRNLQANSTFAPVLNTWYHVAAVGNSATGTLSLYVNGALVASNTNFNGLFVPSAGSNTPWTVGRGQWAGNPGDYFRGNIDEVRISRVALSHTQFLNSDGTGLAFVTHPANASVNLGQNVTFTSLATGAPTYLWQKSSDNGATWSPIEGATAANLTLTNVTLASAGQYRSVASSGEVSINSNPATLTVNYPPPVIVTAPVSRTVRVGSDVTFSVTATGLGNLSYQWRKDGVNIDGATSNVLNLTAVPASADGLYSVVVSDDAPVSGGLPPTTATSQAVLRVLNVALPSRAISVNMVGAASTAAFSNEIGPLSPGEQAGFLPVANWNNSATVTAIGTQPNPIGLLENTGAAVQARATWSSINTWAATLVSGTPASKSPDHRLFHGYIEARSTSLLQRSSVTVTDVPYGTYDVYVYLAGGTANHIGQVQANQGPGIYYRLINHDAFNLSTTPLPFMVSVANSEQEAREGPAVTFVRFANLTGSSLVISASDVASASGTGGINAGGIAAISIVDTTPTNVAYPPLVTAPPASQLRPAGGSTTFTVGASPQNGGTLSYQWRKDGAILGGQTASSLTLSGLTSASTGSYSVSITENSAKGVTSATARADLVVVDANRPVLINADLNPNLNVTQVGDGILRVGGSSASGLGQGSTVWNPVIGAAGSGSRRLLSESTGLQLPDLTFAWTGAQGVEDNTAAGFIANSAMEALSRDYLYTDNQAVPLTGMISGLQAFAGKKITLVVYADGKFSTFFFENTQDDTATVTFGPANNYLNTPPYLTRSVEGRDLVYNNLEYTGGVSAGYATFNGIVSAEGTVAWSLGPDLDGGRIPLGGFQLLLTSEDANIAPSITAQPQSLTRLAGLPASFTAAVTASPAATLQWQKSINSGSTWSDIPEAATATYSIAEISVADAGSYRLQATNAFGVATSEAAILTVQSFPLDPTARSIGISYTHERVGIPPAPLAANEVAGVVGAANWNNRVANVAPSGVLVDSSGEAIEATVTRSNQSGYSVGALAGNLPFQKLYHGYWDGLASVAVGGTATLTVSGLTYTSYDVYVYFVSDGGNRVVQLSANGGVSVFGRTYGSANQPLSLVQATATTAESAVDSNYVRFTGLTGSTATVTLTKLTDNVGIAGIQIVNTGGSAPAAPPGLTAQVSGSNVLLSWNPVVGATGYHVYRSATSGSGYTRIASNVGVASMTDGSAPVGSSYYVVKAVNATGASLAFSNEASATIGSSSPLQSWRQANFGTGENSGNAANSADPDGDGIANLLEYALGTDPNQANGSPVAVGQTGGFLTLTFSRIADSSLTYVIEASNDLGASWTTAQTYPGFGSAGSTTYTDTASIASNPRRFLRLKVTASE